MLRIKNIKQLKNLDEIVILLDVLSKGQTQCQEETDHLGFYKITWLDDFGLNYQGIYNYTKNQKNQIYTSSSSLSDSVAFFFFWSDKNIPH